MPLRVNVGVSKKLGLPNDSSIGASCHLEVELESNLLRDLASFHAQARDAFIAAQQAVNDELARLRAQAVPVHIPGAAGVNGHRNGVPVVNDRPAPPPGPGRSRPS